MSYDSYLLFQSSKIIKNGIRNHCYDNYVCLAYQKLNFIFVTNIHYLGHQHPLSFTITVSHQHLKFCHQHSKLKKTFKFLTSLYHQHHFHTICYSCLFQKCVYFNFYRSLGFKFCSKLISLIKFVYYYNESE